MQWLAFLVTRCYEYMITSNADYISPHLHKKKLKGREVNAKRYGDRGKAAFDVALAKEWQKWLKYEVVRELTPEEEAELKSKELAARLAGNSMQL